MADTNVNSFLFKNKKQTQPTTDYTKFVGFGDAGSAVVKGTPLDTGIKVPSVNPTQPKPVEVQAPATQQPAQTNLTPTKTNPVIVQEAKPTQVGGVDYSQVDNMDTNSLQRYVDEWQVKATMGEEIPTAERMKLLAASRKLATLTSPTTVANPYEAQIKTQEQQRAEREAQLKSQEEAMMSAEERRLNAVYTERSRQAQESGQRQQQSGQQAMSFSGLGRSTFNADQQTRIQQSVESNLATLNEEKFTALERYRAEQAGASAEALAGYDQRINTLKDKQAQFQLQQADQINKYNQDNAASYQDKINNLMTYAQSWKDPNAQLTEQDLATAKAYGQIAIDKDGNINTALLKEIDPKLMSEVIKSAAEARGAIPTNEFGFINVGGGLVAITDPTTGEVRYEQGQVPKEYSLEKIGDTGYVFDPTTGKAKPVSGGTSVTGGQADLYKQLRSGVDNSGKKFFGVYATGDPTGERFINGYYKPAESVGLDNYMAQWNSKGSTITTDMVQQAAQMYGVDPIAVAATMAFDSSMGTKGKGARNNNPGNIGQFDSLDAKGITVAGYPTLQDGVNAVAENLKKRLDASGLTPPSPKGATQGGYTPQTVEEEQLLNSVQQSSGKKTLPSGTVTMLSDGRGLPQLVNTLTSLVDTNSNIFGPIAGRIAGLNEYDTNAQKAQAQLKLASQTVGKFMEGGVLRKEDEVKYEKMLPTLKDKPEVAKAKIEQVKALLESKYKNYLQDFSNSYDVTGFPVTLFGSTPTTVATPTINDGSGSSKKSLEDLF